MTHAPTRKPAPDPRRRASLFAAACGVPALVLPLRLAVAQVAAEGGDWLAMVRQHHDLIARGFEELLRKDDATYERLNLQVRTVDHLLNAHSLAEEAVIYPAIARAGLAEQARKLYADEASVKILKSQLFILVADRQGGGAWREVAGKLQDTVLRHAREAEEREVFPQLQRRLGEDGNRRLADLYVRQFSAVLPVRTS